jgi:hypothetical protein
MAAQRTVLMPAAAPMAEEVILRADLAALGIFVLATVRADSMTLDDFVHGSPLSSAMPVFFRPITSKDTGRRDSWRTNHVPSCTFSE